MGTRRVTAIHTRMDSAICLSLIHIEMCIRDSLDPKCNWAVHNMHLFPVDVNRCSYEMLLRVPGIGVKMCIRDRPNTSSTPFSTPARMTSTAPPGGVSSAC